MLFAGILSRRRITANGPLWHVPSARAPKRKVAGAVVRRSSQFTITHVQLVAETLRVHLLIRFVAQVRPEVRLSLTGLTTNTL